MGEFEQLAGHCSRLESKRTMSKTGHKFRQIAEHIRKSPVGTTLIPLDSTMGFTYLINRPNIERWTIAIPFCAEQVRDEGQCFIFPPRVIVELDVDITELVNDSSSGLPRYRILTVSSPLVDGTIPMDIAKRPMAKFPHDEIANLTRSQYIEKVDDLNDSLAQLLVSLKSNAYNPALDQHFAKQLATLMPKSSRPVYSKLSTWLQYYIFLSDSKGA